MKELTSSKGEVLDTECWKVEYLEKMVVLVGWEVGVMEDWEVVMLVIWVGGKALDDKDL